MPATRLIDDSGVRPSPSSYFAVALGAAVLVLAGAALIAGQTASKLVAEEVLRSHSFIVGSHLERAAVMPADVSMGRRVTFQASTLDDREELRKSVSVPAGVPVQITLPAPLAENASLSLEGSRVGAVVGADRATIELPGLAPGLYRLSSSDGLVIYLVRAE